MDDFDGLDSDGGLAFACDSSVMGLFAQAVPARVPLPDVGFDAGPNAAFEKQKEKSIKIKKDKKISSSSKSKSKKVRSHSHEVEQ